MYQIVSTQRLQKFDINWKANFDHRAPASLTQRYEQAQDHSVYRVCLSAKVKYDKLHALPDVKVQHLQRKYNCKCKGKLMLSWVCSNVLTAASINDHINLKEVQAGILYRRLPADLEKSSAA
ncbi:hypothetical protein GN244_ATG09630 [Phytophthora infestans]|uniref:Uncharacterized protein n=1 Tax=Phytophthora infestans TaxID=4787 RepID=A0A833SR44_PHYIN|nr:hypothetical protein GN244_ATG09630 [Phytophthora infestans]